MAGSSCEMVVSSFYEFIAFERDNLSQIAADVLARGKENEIYGLFILAAEGMNATFSGSAAHVENFKNYLRRIAAPAELAFKEHTVGFRPFKRWKVDVREEIVTLKDPRFVNAVGLRPVRNRSMHGHQAASGYLSPEEWQNLLESGEDLSIIDVRNWYETRVGMFKGARDPWLKAFSEFPGYVENSGLPKDKPVLMYCTGGIRCEKAALVMLEAGYKSVLQLEGGILKYLEQFPNRSFNGECFVFDHRVCVDQDLKPSKRYALCPHCGNPGDVEMTCGRCGRTKRICRNCQTALAGDPKAKLCGKSCPGRAHGEARGS